MYISYERWLLRELNMSYCLSRSTGLFAILLFQKIDTCKFRKILKTFCNVRTFDNYFINSKKTSYRNGSSKFKAIILKDNKFCSKAILWYTL